MARVPTGLVDASGRPIEREVLTQEIVTPTIGGVRSIITGYPGDGLTPVTLAGILRQADQGDPLRYLELAEQVEERDLHYAGVLGTRKRSVTQLEITVKAGGDDAASERQAETIRQWLDRDTLQEELFDLLDAVGKGFAVSEIIWDTSEGSWMPVRLESRDQRFFRFDEASGTRAQLRTMAGQGEDLPPFKFITAVMRGKSGLPIRSGVARLALWAWLFKSYAQRDWAIFVQNYGQPIRLGKYGQGSTEADREILYEAVVNIAGDCAAIVPQSMEIEFVEAKSTQAAADLYERRCNWLDQQVSKAVLGQTATTDAIAGGHAVGQEHRQVQEDIERADARALAAILNRDLIRPWIQLEFGPQKVYPRLSIGRPDETDVAQTVDAVTKLVPMGLRVSQEEIRGILGLCKPEPEDEVLIPPGAAASAAPGAEPGAGAPPPPPPPPVPGQPARTALQAAGPASPPAPADAIDAAVAAMLADDGWEPLMAPIADGIEAALDGAATIEDVRDRLAAHMAGMDVSKLADALGRLGFSARLAGAAGESLLTGPKT